MPGVPSGKGCDACRKQKKKCDQAKPACARCTRLSIACVGGGQQRYKFKVQVLEAESEPVKMVTKKVRIQKTNPLAVMPRSRTMAIATVFVSRLAVDDLRYDIQTYGTFLRYIPQRIGKNAALDAAVDAFATGFSTLHSDAYGLEAFQKYGHALKALGECLDDPVRGQTPETMCAIYLIMVVQGWIGLPGAPSSASHGEGLAYLLKAMADKDWSGAFEMEMLVAMCVPVIMESVVNPRIKLNPWFHKMLDRFRGPDGPPHPDYQRIKRLNPDVFSSISLRSLSRYPAYFKDPIANHLDIFSSYHLLRIDCQKLQRKCTHVTDKDLATRPGFTYVRVQHGLRVAYNIALTLALLLNTILQQFDPSDTSLVNESKSCINEIIRQAEEAYDLRPLGSSHVPISLTTAWAVSKDETLKDHMTRLMLEYQTDFGSSCDWVKMGGWWKLTLDKLHRKIARRNIDPALLPISAESEELMSTIDGDCAMQ
ncbi:hypothetical protein B0T10DRAFT_497905 [Thelonectria olida]|uniref:Zn(2)-C6 fungal-type domain-containing protein n=1 Tax=Thelonectria olida TaxID=1576542 RepID=A0A9P8VWA8_9HYPO|nr:hypothetical protein B0T10DRAFT_497905 [Thelonectria olida]